MVLWLLVVATTVVSAGVATADVDDDVDDDVVVFTETTVKSSVVAMSLLSSVVNRLVDDIVDDVVGDIVDDVVSGSSDVSALMVKVSLVSVVVISASVVVWLLKIAVSFCVLTCFNRRRYSALKSVNYMYVYLFKISYF